MGEHGQEDESIALATNYKRDKDAREEVHGALVHRVAWPVDGGSMVVLEEKAEWGKNVGGEGGDGDWCLGSWLCVVGGRKAAGRELQAQQGLCEQDKRAKAKI